MKTDLFSVGEPVWWAHCGQREVVHPCPVCFGKLRVTVILGNDEAISTPCDYCGKGYDGPQGIEREYEWVASPELVTVCGVSTEQDGSKTVARYKSAGYILDQEDVFSTREEAVARCVERAAEHKADEDKRRTHMKEHSHKSFSWHVGYHRRQIKEAKRQLEWHEARAIACAGLARTPLATALI